MRTQCTQDFEVKEVWRTCYSRGGRTYGEQIIYHLKERDSKHPGQKSFSILGTAFPREERAVAQKSPTTTHSDTGLWKRPDIKWITFTNTEPLSLAFL